MYESRTHPPISRQHFVRRMMLHTGFAFGILVLSLAIGMAGYRAFEQLPWRDAFLNTAMLLGGMGPIGDGPQTAAGKLFAGLYALYSGMIFLVLAAIVLGPVIHRLLHRFHWEADRAGKKGAA